MSQRNEFSLDDDFDEEREDDLDKIMVVAERRPKAGRNKAPQAAWSRLEDVLNERRLQRELEDDYDID